MRKKSIFGVALAVAVLASAPIRAETCSGEFTDFGNGFYGIGGCRITTADARKIMNVCSLGQQCVATGTIEHCPDIRGACAQLTRITSAKWGQNLPPCSPYDAIARANQWWSNGSSIIVKGTIVRSRNDKENVSPPFGHLNIVMDLTTCGTGSPMPVDRAPEAFVGHYVELNGTAMKGPEGWYIIARHVGDARQQ
jgi:hypothetical protein